MPDSKVGFRVEGKALVICRVQIPHKFGTGEKIFSLIQEAFVTLSYRNAGAKADSQ